MSRVRFPKAKYLRQLRAIERDMWVWQNQYTQTSRLTTSQWLAFRFDQRAVALEDVRVQLVRTIGLVEQLPRLQ